jgi:hypothetical protein
MLLDFATNPRGVTYAYFICSGRAAKKTTRTRRAVPVAVAERLVADSYASITISDNTYQRIGHAWNRSPTSCLPRTSPAPSTYTLNRRIANQAFYTRLGRC